MGYMTEIEKLFKACRKHKLETKEILLFDSIKVKLLTEHIKREIEDNPNLLNETLLENFEKLVPIYKMHKKTRKG